MYKLKYSNGSVIKCFEETVKKYPTKNAIEWEGGTWTFEKLHAYSNQVANYLISQGIKCGDEVCLLMENRPEFIGIWLGAAKVGVVTAFLNTNLKGNSLVHSITVVKSRGLIFSARHTEQVKEILPILKDKIPQLKYYIYPSNGNEANGNQLTLDLNLINNKASRIGKQVNEVTIGNGLSNNNNFANSNGNYDTSHLVINEVNEEILNNQPAKLHLNTSTNIESGFSSKLFYVYTSGTTGLPKAAIIRNARYLFLGTGANYLIGLKPSDSIYCPIPLYHMSGGAIGTCQMLIHGCTFVLREKFSASNFWSDCVKFNCTAAQYIGEICRYLLVQPVSQMDQKHKVRVMFGNGLRSNIWSQFRERFALERICEFYGATEGNANVVNYTGKEGACGFISRLLPLPIVNLIYPVNIVRVDEVTGDLIRDEKTGLCIPCGPGEVGEFVGKINSNDPTRTFDGYVNKEASEKKIYRNVFKQGDMVFSSGDLLTIDEFGYVYFKDRTGDTFRWKGENVSTTEVETAIMNIVHSDVVVFGVTITGCEGKAGMVAIADANNALDVSNLYLQLTNSLPAYAVPMFVRIVEKLETTGTFKLPKVDLQKQGYNPNVVKDPLYYLNGKHGYQRLDANVYEDIISGRIRL